MQTIPNSAAPTAAPHQPVSRDDAISRELAARAANLKKTISGVGENELSKVARAIAGDAREHSEAYTLRCNTQQHGE